MGKPVNFRSGVASQGIPLQGPSVPTVKGNVYYVDKLNGSNANQGKSMTSAFATIAKAISVVNARINWAGDPWGNQDCIVILPGKYEENLTSLPHGAIMMGLGHSNDDGNNGVLISPATGLAVNVSAVVNTEILNIGFQTSDKSIAFKSLIINNCLISGCRFVGDFGSNPAAHGIYCNDSDRLRLIGNSFRNCGIGFECAYVDANDKLHDGVIKDNEFTDITNKGIFVQDVNLLVNNTIVCENYIQADAASSQGIDDDSDGLVVANNTIFVGTGGTPLDVNAALAVNNYTMISGGNRAILPAYT